MNSNDNNVYVVQCTKNNLEDIHCMLTIAGRVLTVDSTSCSIKTMSIDSTMKKRLCDAGASFWQEAVHETTKKSARQR